MTDSKDNDQTKDRPFNPFRIAKNANAKAVVMDVLGQLQKYEQIFNVRKRARKPDDQKVFEQQVEALVCDLIHRALTEPNGWLAISFSKTVLSRVDRYGSPVMSKTLPDVVRRMTAPEMDFISLELGYENPFVPGKGRQTRACQIFCVPEVMR